MSEKPRTSFSGASRAAVRGERQSLDLGKPRYCIRNEKTGEVTWIWCNKCGARRNENGEGYAGGQLWLLKPGESIGDKVGEKLPRTAGIVYCDCALGQHRRRAYTRITGHQPPALSKYSPDRLIGPNIIRYATERCIDAAENRDVWEHITLAGPFGGDPEADQAAGRDLQPTTDDQLDLVL